MTRKIISNSSMVFLLLAFLSYSCNQSSTEEKTDPESKNGWHIHENGSFDFKYKDIELKNCFPAIDDQNIRPLSVETEKTNSGERIVYELTKGRLFIELSDRDSVYLISTRLEGFEKAPDWVLPLADGMVKGADRFYKQGFGFAGASGIFPLPEPEARMERAVLKEDIWSFDSYLFTGLLSPGNDCFVASAYDHKDYQHRSTLYNKQHRIGLIDRHEDTNVIFFETGFGTERIEINGDILQLPDIYIMTGDDPYRTFRQQALNMADFNNVELNISPRYYYCSWYEYKSDYTSKVLLEMLSKLKDVEPQVNIQTLQIDDGYAPRGDWLNFNEKFPEGMEEVVKKIKQKNIDAGIWVGPFMVGENSFIFREHKEWLLKNTDGDLFAQGADMYVLDTSHPDAFEYLRKVFHNLREMGFTTFKTDFLDWGIIDSDKVSRYTPGKTSVQYFMDVMRMIDEEIGEESYWLACISPFGQMISYADGMRLSNDVWSWSSESAGNMFREIYAGQFFNNILWQNDPDVIYLRNYDVQFNKTQKYSLALYSGFMGGTITTSCRFHTLDQEMLELWRFIQPGEERVTASLPFWGEKRNILVATREYGNDRAALFVNISDSALSEYYNLSMLTGMENAECFEWKPGNYSSLGTLDDIKISLQPGESKLVYFSQSGNSPPEFMNR